MNYEDQDTLGIYRNNPPAGSEGDVWRGPGPALMGANTLVGNDVYNDRDEDVGDITEILLDMRSGKVAYAVLSFGGFLGVADRLFAVPWNVLTLDTKKKRFVLNVDKARLRDPPGFDKDHWPDMADESWVRELHAYYGTHPYREDYESTNSYSEEQPV